MTHANGYPGSEARRKRESDPRYREMQRRHAIRMVTGFDPWRQTPVRTGLVAWLAVRLFTAGKWLVAIAVAAMIAADAWHQGAGMLP